MMGSSVNVSPSLLQAEAAAVIGVSTRTLRTWRRTNFGPRSVKVGSARLYDQASVLAFAAGVR